MKRMTQSIVIKVFMITAVSIVIFIIASLYFQNTLFKNFYNDNRAVEVTEKVGEFANRMVSSRWSEEELIRQTTTFEQQTGIVLAVVDAQGSVLNEEDYEIIIRTNVSKILHVIVDSQRLTDSYLSTLISPGDSIHVVGNIWGVNGNYVDPNTVRINENSIILDAISEGEQANDNYYGTILGFHLPNQNIGVAKSNEAKRAVRTYYNGSPEISYTEKYQQFTQRNQTSNMDDAVFVYHINDVANRYNKVFAIVDQTVILEATNAISNFYPYFLSLAVILAVIISIFMTRLVSDPLVDLNNRAKRLAEFDFNQFIQVKRKDEIGSLATSLNTLSFNLKKNRDELESKNKTLREDIERERHLEKKRKDFISSASHELKTPLGIIRGFSEGIKDGIAEADELDYYIDVILEEVDKMDSLVLDMLELSKMQRDVKRIKLEDFDFVALLDDLLLRFSPQFLESSINVVKNYSEDPIEVEADYDKVEQVLKNLISNACRYGKSTSDLFVGIQQVNDEVFFSIENKADPIPEDKIAHIWDRFYRVDDARHREIGGTGLGLAIVREILESHQWKYGVKNTDYGVQFYFYFKAKS